MTDLVNIGLIAWLSIRSAVAGTAVRGDPVRADVDGQELACEPLKLSVSTLSAVVISVMFAAFVVRTKVRLVTSCHAFSADCAGTVPLASIH